jgi:hypothetical protein
MTSVITGDIINSRSRSSSEWIDDLKNVLRRVGESPKYWEIYRGDSFQLEIENPKEALYRAIQIKAAIKCFKHLDARMSIGIGEKDYDAEKITEANGPAFIYSGEGLNSFKDVQTLSVSTNISSFDYDMNLLLKLALIVMDNWTPAVAEYVSLNLRGGFVQQQIAELLGISQSSVSERHQRSYINEIREVENLYRDKITAYKLDA